MEILSRDADLILCVKPVGLDSEHELPRMLQGQLALDRPPFCVHRLDKSVGGLMVYAADAQAAAALSLQLTDGSLKKTYLAVLRGVPDNPSGRLQDLLYHDTRNNKSYVVSRSRRGVKQAVLEYQILQTLNDSAESLTLVQIQLVTGRAHQIRVQFSSRGLPLLGDGRYGGGRGQPALWSWQLQLLHPRTATPIHAACLPQGHPWNRFSFCTSRV